MLRSQGTMHARDPLTGELRRMSKSAGNVVTPDSVAETHGADALRIYLLFMAPFENNTVWDEEGINGARRFLGRIWRLANEAAGIGVGSHNGRPVAGSEERLARIVRRTAGKVMRQIERLEFNTAVAALMKCLNAMSAHRAEPGRHPVRWVGAVRDFVLILAPFAPHIAEELWERLGGQYSVHYQPWPAWEAEAEIAEETVTLVVQVDGRLRDCLELPAGAGEDEVSALALASPAVQRTLRTRAVARIVHVPDRLVNIVTG